MKIDVGLYILIQISQKFISKGQINDEPALVHAYIHACLLA